jgi:hypothetical protein
LNFTLLFFIFAIHASVVYFINDLEIFSGFLPFRFFLVSFFLDE